MKRVDFTYGLEFWIIGFFWDKKNKWLYILPFPILGIIIKFNLFKNWMDELKSIAIKNNPRDYKEGDEWVESYFKVRYYDNGLSPAAAWTDYTDTYR